jgi:hypothetical protein
MPDFSSNRRREHGLAARGQCPPIRQQLLSDSVQHGVVDVLLICGKLKVFFKKSVGSTGGSYRSLRVFF